MSWLGGARLGGVINRVANVLSKEPYPTTIIVHIGTNDVFTDFHTRNKVGISELLFGLRNLLPTTRIIWSDILLRLFYYGETIKGAGKRTVIALNKHARKSCKVTGSYALSHYPSISVHDHALYRFTSFRRGQPQISPKFRRRPLMF